MFDSIIFDCIDEINNVIDENKCCNDDIAKILLSLYMYIGNPSIKETKLQKKARKIMLSMKVGKIIDSIIKNGLEQND